MKIESDPNCRFVSEGDRAPRVVKNPNSFFDAEPQRAWSRRVLAPGDVHGRQFRLAGPLRLCAPPRLCVEKTQIRDARTCISRRRDCDVAPTLASSQTARNTVNGSFFALRVCAPRFSLPSRFGPPFISASIGCAKLGYPSTAVSAAFLACRAPRNSLKNPISTPGDAPEFLPLGGGTTVAPSPPLARASRDAALCRRARALRL